METTSKNWLLEMIHNVFSTNSLKYLLIQSLDFILFLQISLYMMDYVLKITWV